MQPGSIRHLFRLKRACKTEAYWKIRICVSAGLSICFAVLFYFCALFQFASVLQGTGKGAEDEKSEQLYLLREYVKDKPYLQVADEYYDDGKYSRRVTNR